MRTDFCTNITDELLGIVMVYDFECEVEVSTTVSDGSVSTDVTDVLVDNKSMFQGDEFAKKFAAKVAGYAQDNITSGGHLWDRICEAESIVYVGLGGNDPDGRFKRAVS